MNKEIQIEFKSDEKGMVGRQCPAGECGSYFKLKPGSGLNTDVTRCPYCENESASGDFLTTDQREYAISVAAREMVSPLVKRFVRNVERLNRHQPRGLIRLDVSVRHEPVSLHHYLEKRLETEVTCDKCGLDFAVYGVFASCPGCGRLNALTIFLSSLDTARKKLELSRDESLDEDLRLDLLKDSLNGPVAAFDAYGKALRTNRTITSLSARPNLFQNIEALDVDLQAAGFPSVEQLMGSSIWEDLRWFFQARHIYTHRAGVVDDRFVSKQPTYAHMLGRVLPLDADRIGRNIDSIGLLAEELDARMK